MKYILYFSFLILTILAILGSILANILYFITGLIVLFYLILINIINDIIEAKLCLISDLTDIKNEKEHEKHF